MATLYKTIKFRNIHWHHPLCLMLILILIMAWSSVYKVDSCKDDLPYCKTPITYSGQWKTSITQANVCPPTTLSKTCAYFDTILSMDSDGVQTQGQCCTDIPFPKPTSLLSGSLVLNRYTPFISQTLLDAPLISSPAPVPTWKYRVPTYSLTEIKTIVLLV